MKKLNKIIFAFIFILFIFHAKIIYARTIYVKLSGAGAWNVGASAGNIMMVDADGRIANLGESALISAVGNQIDISGNLFNMPIKLTCDGLMIFNGKSYHGNFLITQKAGLINVVDLENYVCGVLPGEVSPSWPKEALRAQAIIARTYAIYKSMSRAERGYDVVDTVMDQVYKGAGFEAKNTNQAVYSTASEIVVYNNAVAFTPFHSDSGGFTANNSDVWAGKQLPYLSVVAEAFNYKSPVSNWSVKISSAKIQSVIEKITGHNVGTVHEVQISDVDEGGRAVKITVVGSNGSETVSASQFRSNVDPNNLKSTMFTPSGNKNKSNNNITRKKNIDDDRTPPPGTVVYKNSNPDEMTSEQEQQLAKMTAEGIFTTTELIDMLTNPEKQKKYYEAGLKRSGEPKISALKPDSNPKPKINKYGFTVEKSGNEFIFYGKGWGHGVGLSQWGAYEMARQGWNAEKIVTHYYPGTVIKKFK